MSNDLTDSEKEKLSNQARFVMELFRDLVTHLRLVGVDPSAIWIPMLSIAVDGAAAEGVPHTKFDTMTRDYFGAVDIRNTIAAAKRSETNS